jgi:UDP-N-acetylglucosamine transferase subunit ALG13
MREADAVVCHAGVGTLMTAVSLGRVPVAMPRLRAHGEHVDDHQAQIARELGSAGYVIPCVEGADLPAALRRAGSAGAGRRTTSGDLRHAAILAAGGRPAPAGPATEI